MLIVSAPSLKKSEVFEAAADVEPALEEARVAALPERHERADDDGDAERRDHDDVDVGAALAQRRVGDAFDDDAEQEHEHEREQVADAERETEAVDGRRRLARSPTSRGRRPP